MKLGIVGLPNVGKSTLFNSLTKAGADVANYPFCTIDPNVGVVAVPDERIKKLGEMYHSKKITPAVIEFVDIAGLVKGASKGEGLGNQFLANIRECDAIVHVVRCFEDPNVTHVDGSVDPVRDIAVREVLRGRTTVVTGPSGAGKSSLINFLCPEAKMETGELSRKIARGKNTTRHVELLHAGEDTFLVDTPGFTSLYLQDVEADHLKDYYPEFTRYAKDCRFQGCNHLMEPDCAVKKALQKGEISRIRYTSYTEIYAELKDRKMIYR